MLPSISDEPAAEPEESDCGISLARRYELDIDIETERVQKCAVKRAAELLREDATLEFRRCHEHGAAAVKAYRLKLAETRRCR